MLVLNHPENATALSDAMAKSWPTKEEEVRESIDNRSNVIRELQAAIMNEPDLELREQLMRICDEEQAELSLQLNNLTSMEQQLGVVINFMSDMRNTLFDIQQGLKQLQASVDELRNDVRFLIGKPLGELLKAQKSRMMGQDADELYVPLFADLLSRFHTSDSQADSQVREVALMDLVTSFTQARIVSLEEWEAVWRNLASHLPREDKPLGPAVEDSAYQHFIRQSMFKPRVAWLLVLVVRLQGLTRCIPPESLIDPQCFPAAASLEDPMSPLPEIMPPMLPSEGSIQADFAVCFIAIHELLSSNLGEFSSDLKLTSAQKEWFEGIGIHIYDDGKTTGFMTCVDRLQNLAGLRTRAWAEVQINHLRQHLRKADTATTSSFDTAAQALLNTLDGTRGGDSLAAFADETMDMEDAPHRNSAELVRGMRDLVKLKLAADNAHADGQLSTLIRQKVMGLIINHGETCEWMVGEYIRDAMEQGKTCAMIVLGHVMSEQEGMRFYIDWLKPAFRDVPMFYAELTELFNVR